MLDGSLGSLQAALNVLEIFGTLSGLKINTNKTKLVWIGRKRYSRDKLNISINLEWGNTSFILLGLEYSIVLETMSNINFDRILLTSKKIIQLWKKRKITPIGRITVIKTLILSKFNHLFCAPFVYKKIKQNTV